MYYKSFVFNSPALLYSRYMDAYFNGVRLRPRLEAVMDMVTGDTAADIGADHGRLSLALLQRGRAKRVICSDVSAQSLKKARLLAQKCGVSGLEFREGDGLSVLSPGEAETLIFAGMGGTLIADMLARGEDIARAAGLMVFQPMRSSEDLREYLYTHGYTIVDERLVLDAGRYYQVMAARSGEDALPAFWPKGMYALGPLLYTRRDPLLPTVVERYIVGHERRLARAKGGDPEALRAALSRLYALQKLIKEGY